MTRTKRSKLVVYGGFLLFLLLALASGPATPLSAQSASSARDNAAQAKNAKDNASAASQKASEDAAKAAADKKAAEDAAAQAREAALKAEVAKADAAKKEAEQQAEAAKRAADAAQKTAEAEKQRQAAEAAKAAAEQAKADAAAAKAAAEQAESDREAAEAAAEAAAQAAHEAELRADAEAEAKRTRDAEAAALQASADRAEEESRKLKESTDAVKQNKDRADENEAKSKQAADDARIEADAAEESARKAKDSADESGKAADKAAEKAEEAAAAEQRLLNAKDDAERGQAKQDLQDAIDQTALEKGNAEKHAQDAGDHGQDAQEHKDNAHKKVEDLPPPTPDVQAVLTSRSWLLCGGAYAGWSGPGLCAAVTLDAVSDATQSFATIVMKVRNLSGLFQSYAGSVLTGIGLTNILGENPTDLKVEGPCVPTDQDCASQWGLAVGPPHAHMPNGIGAVDLKFGTQGLLGGIASTCAADVQPPQIDKDGKPVEVPANPNGLFTNECFGDDWVTMSFTTSAPVDFTHTQLSLRAQNGYPNGSGSTACISSDTQSGTADNNDCFGPPPPVVTPEPATMALLGTGLAGVAGAVRRRRKAREDAKAREVRA